MHAGRVGEHYTCIGHDGSYASFLVSICCKGIIFSACRSWGRVDQVGTWFSRVVGPNAIPLLRVTPRFYFILEDHKDIEGLV